MSGATLARRAVILTCVVAFIVGLITAVSPPEKADAAIPAGFTSTPVFTGLTLPTGIAFSPDGKVYVAEKSGIVKVFPNASSNNGVVFKDLTTRVFNFWDRGLLGITVDPRLGNGTGHDFVYVLYAKDAPPGQTPPVWNDDCPTPPGGLTDGCVVGSTLSRIPVNANGTAGAEQILIDDEWCQQFTTHSAGHLAWGFDGSLYVTGGDGASYENADWGQFGGSLAGSPTPKNPCGDPPGSKGVGNTSPTGRGGAMRSQSVRRPAGEPRVLSGALLRLNPDTGAGVPGNPMYNAATPAANASRILAYGFRNPFRFTTRPGTNEIWVADVGWGIYEEIDRVTTPTPTVAPNYGWPCLEWETHLSGYRDLDMCKALYNDTANQPRNPYFAYEHGQSVPGGGDTCGAGEDGSSITGAAFYSGTKYPTNYKNALFFADNARELHLDDERGCQRVAGHVDREDVHRQRQRSTPGGPGGRPGLEGHLLREHRGGDGQPDLLRFVQPGADRSRVGHADVGHRAPVGAAQRLGVDRSGRRHAHLLVGHGRQRHVRRRDRQDPDGQLPERRDVPGPAPGDRSRWAHVDEQHRDHHGDEPERSCEHRRADRLGDRAGRQHPDVDDRDVERIGTDHLRAAVAALHGRRHRVLQELGARERAGTRTGGWERRGARRPRIRAGTPVREPTRVMWC